MSDLGRRFKFYGIGFLIGCFFVILLFGRRSSCRDYINDYLPSGRVLSEVRFLPKSYSEGVKNQLKNLALDTAFIHQRVLKEGEINFDESSPREKPCGIYALNYVDSTYNLEMNFKKCRDTVYIENIILKNK